MRPWGTPCASIRARGARDAPVIIQPPSLQWEGRRGAAVGMHREAAAALSLRRALRVSEIQCDAHRGNLFRGETCHRYGRGALIDHRAVRVSEQARSCTQRTVRTSRFLGTPVVNGPLDFDNGKTSVMST